MKTPHLLATGLALAWPFLLASSGFSQGALLPPPGPPAPTMKTLDQVEARIIVNATNTPGDATNSFIISAPGSYYLTGNIAGETDKNGISIQADDVTLDLNGFALIGLLSAYARGVNTPNPQTNFCIRNGSVRGWPAGGVWAVATTTLAEKLRLSGNISAIGLTVGNGSLVKDCVADNNYTGFFCSDRTQISNCIATVNTGAGFQCENFVNMIDCTASRNGSNGIVVLGSSSVIRCNASRNIPLGGSFGGHGIVAGAGCTIADCTAGSNTFTGIETDGSSVTNCAANYNTGTGIFAYRSTVASSSANYNGGFGISAERGSVTSSSAGNNAGSGIFAFSGSVANCLTGSNGSNGIEAADGSVANSVSSSNVLSGIVADEPSVTNCVARRNGKHGIAGSYSVITFCKASGNNQNNNDGYDIITTNATRFTNQPAP